MNKAQKERALWGGIIVTIFVIFDLFKIQVNDLGWSIVIGLLVVLGGVGLLYLINKDWFKNLHNPFK